MTKSQPQLEVVESSSLDLVGSNSPSAPEVSPKTVDATPETNKKGILKLSVSDWLILTQTIILAITLYYLGKSTNEQARSTQLLAASVEEQARITALSITPNLGGGLRMKYGPRDTPTLEIIITNYSAFPLYVNYLDCEFSEASGWREDYKTNVVYLPPDQSVELTSLSMSKKDWRQDNEKLDWPVRLGVRTSIGTNWEVLFKAPHLDRRFHNSDNTYYLIEPSELWFESIRLVDNSENPNKTGH